MRIVIADDHPVFQDGLRHILEDYGHVVVATCCDGAQAVEETHARDADLVIMDLQMPTLDGLAAIRQLGGEPPSVVLTVSEDAADICEAERAGARGYLLKSTQVGELVRMLEAIVEGYRIFPGSTLRVPENRLSARQRDVLDGITRGLTLKEIAAELGISRHTVRTYQERLINRFAVNSRAELIFAASKAAR